MKENPSFSTCLGLAIRFHDLSDLPFDLHHGQQLCPTLTYDTNV